LPYVWQVLLLKYCLVAYSHPHTSSPCKGWLNNLRLYHPFPIVAPGMGCLSEPSASPSAGD
jgi:hypothetical protein